jgi:putative toxin-antitoxin system antitoxin component (TIGR02293 family)
MALQYRQMATLASLSLPFADVERLSAKLTIAPSDLLDLIGVSERTANRRRHEGLLHKDEADRLLRVERIFKTAIRVFGSEKKAATWLNRPRSVLGGVTPLSLLDTDAGASEVTQELGRIEYGIFA